MIKAACETFTPQEMRVAGGSTLKPDALPSRQARSYRYLESFSTTVPVACADRALLMTESFRQTEGEPLVLRWAKAMMHIARNISISIGPYDLIVGRASAKPGRYGLIYPEMDGGVLAKAVDIIVQTQKPYIISDDVARVLKYEVAPYWAGRCFHEALYSALPPETRRLLFKDAFTQRNVVTETASYRNSLQWVPDYDKVLTKGLAGIQKEAQQRLSSLDPFDPKDALERIPFLQAIITICDAAILFSKRYAALASEMAASEPDGQRKLELLRIAAICEWVPQNPARTFHEALQSQWMVSIFKRLEEKVGGSYSNGRMDQYLYRFYKRGLADGTLTEESAMELLENLWLNMAQFINLYVSPTALAYNEGYTHWEAVTIGGQTPDGRDATNELSYLFLKSKQEFPLNFPDLAVRVHSLSPDRFLREVCETIKDGSGFPKLFNDEEIIPLLIAKGADLKEANDYAASGCTEVRMPNKDVYTSPCCWINLPAALEMALNNGTMKKFPGEQLGLNTGDPLSFASYSELWSAYCAQQEHLLKHVFITQYLVDKLRPSYVATPLSSALHDLCMASCKDLHSGDIPGGAKLGFYDLVGFATVIDSLAAIRKLVYEDKAITMAEMLEALDGNFTGTERVRQMLLNAPKFGNNDPYTDEIGRDIEEEAVRISRKYRSYFGTELDVRYVPLTIHIPCGKVIGATPNGRKAWEYLSEGSSASHGSDVKGPTGLLLSNAHSKASGSKERAARLLNLKLSPATVAGREGTTKLMSLIRTFCDLKLWHIQFNIINRATLLAAQAEPEKYRNLLVRVAGYSAYFVDLSPQLQGEIIARTEHTF